LNEELKEKIKLISQIDNYNARFVVRVLEAFENKQKEFEEKRRVTDIFTKEYKIDTNKKIIDLDKIWAKPYFYTKMRVKLEELLNQVISADNKEIMRNSSKFFKKVIYNKAIKNFEKSENKTDIIEFIKDLNNKKIDNDFNFIFIAEKVDEETIFKEEQIKKAIEIIRIEDIKEKYSMIYDEICDYLNKDFLQNGYCDFKNDKCIAQRKHKFYPPNRKNGCCSRQIRKCPNLVNGNCVVECVACKLFSCKYFEKRGIAYFGREIILLQAFFNERQRKHFVFDFYQSKESVLSKVCEDRGK
jgi:hypothetical protein